MADLKDAMQFLGSDIHMEAKDDATRTKITSALETYLWDIYRMKHATVDVQEAIILIRKALAISGKDPGTWRMMMNFAIFFGVEY